MYRLRTGATAPDGKRRQRSRGDGRWESDLAGSRGVIEDACGTRERPIGRGVVHHLGMINAEASSHDHPAFARASHRRSPREERSRGGIRERLPLIAQPDVDRQISAHANIVLDKQRPQRVVHGVERVAVALGIASDVGDVLQIGRTFADTATAGCRCCRRIGPDKSARRIPCCSRRCGRRSPPRRSSKYDGRECWRVRRSPDTGD